MSNWVRQIEIEREMERDIQREEEGEGSARDCDKRGTEMVE